MCSRLASSYIAHESLTLTRLEIIENSSERSHAARPLRQSLFSSTLVFVTRDCLGFSAASLWYRDLIGLERALISNTAWNEEELTKNWRPSLVLNSGRAASSQIIEFHDTGRYA